MNRDDVAPAFQAKEFLLPAFAFITTTTTSLTTFIMDGDTWLAFFTGLGGILSLARIIQIIVDVRAKLKKSKAEIQLHETTEAIERFNRNTERLMSRHDKEQALMSDSQPRGRHYPPTKNID